MQFLTPQCCEAIRAYCHSVCITVQSAFWHCWWSLEKKDGRGGVGGSPQPNPPKVLQEQKPNGKMYPSTVGKPSWMGSRELVFCSGGTPWCVMLLYSQGGVGFSVLYWQREALHASRHCLHMAVSLQENQLKSMEWSCSLQTAETLFR